MAKQKKKKAKKKAQNKRGKQTSILLIFLTAIVISAFFLYKYFKAEPDAFESNKYFVKGIDISHHNPILNWNEVYAQNITFAYLKATEGVSHKDRNYVYNYDLARKANVKVGAYHFYSFGLSGKEQANHFIQTANCKPGDLIPAIDVEHSKANVYSKDTSYVSIVIEELKSLDSALYVYYGVRPIIYTNKDCYKLYVKDNFQDNLLWISDLHNEPDGKMTKWRIWQFSHKGELSGVLGEHFDLNYYRYSYEEFKELLLP